MTSQQQTWYRAGSDIVARAGFSLVMCGALAAVIYVTHRNGSEELAAASMNNAPRVAIVLPGIAENPGVSVAQAAIDASPAAAPVVANIPIPTLRVAAAGDPAPRHAPVPAKRAVREAVVASARTVSFESCLPGCETKDPLIVGHVAAPQVPAAFPQEGDTLVETVSFQEREPGLLGRAMDAPSLVYRTGRKALTSLVAAAL